MDSIGSESSSQQPEYAVAIRKLDLPAMAAAGGLLWGAAVLFVGLLSTVLPSYGREFLAVLSSLYPLYSNTGSFPDLLIGVVIAAVDGGIAGLVFGWLYNRIAGR
jgi:hypothetical protein